MALYALLAFLALVTDTAFGSGRLNAPAKVAPFRHVESHERRETSDPPAHLYGAMGRTVELVFAAEGMTFELDLELYEAVYGKGGRTLKRGEDGEMVEVPRPHRHFTGTATVMHASGDVETGSAAVSFYENEMFRAVISTVEDEYYVDKLSVHRNSGAFEGEHASELLGEDKGHGMALVRLSETVHHANGESHVPGPFETKPHTKRSGGRSLQALDKWTGCFANQWSYLHLMNIGIVTDPSYNSVFGNIESDIMTSLGNLFTVTSGAASNTIYEQQMNIRLALGDTIVDGSTGLSRSGSASMNDRLNELSSWRTNYYNSNNGEQNGLWHLMTNEHAPPGTVGLAWVGTLCSYTHGTGVTNYIRDSWGGTWKTFAHEVGHNYGASHSFENGQGSTGGIMDYGDGYYQSVYQFHPYRESEVCKEIEESRGTRKSWLNMIPLDNCWQQGTGTSPVPPPTRSPADAPTDPPTDRPTPSPVDNGGGGGDNGGGSTNPDKGYYWYKYDNYYGDCFPSTTCGPSYKSEVVRCWEYTYSTESWNQVDDSACDPLTKPTPNTQQCTGLPDCDTSGNLCGNGKIDVGEVCDSKLDSCCDEATGCKAYKTDSLQCWQANGVIDAIFQDYQGRVYVFQGPYYARYSTYNYGWSNNQPDAGFPKTIQGSFPISSFASDITAAAYLSDEEVYVFKNSQYVKLSMTGGEYSGYPKDAFADWKVPDDFKSCGKVTAAVAWSNYQMWFCDSIFSYVHPTYNYNYLKPVSQFGGNWVAITGVYNWPQSNSIKLFGVDSSGNAARRRLDGTASNSIFVNTIINDLSEVADQSCTDENCATCEVGVNADICTACQDLYTHYDFKCLDDEILLYLDFEKDSAYTVDYLFVQGGKQALANMEYSSDNSTMEFKGTTSLAIAQPDLGNAVVREFMIGARFYPDSITEGDVIMTIDDGAVVLSFTAMESPTGEFRLQLVVGEQTFRSTVNSTINAGEWNTFEVGYTQDMFVSIVNGDNHVVAFQTLFVDGAIDLDFHQWAIGDATQGLVGEIDEMYLTKKVVGLRISPTFDLSDGGDGGDGGDDEDGSGSDDGWVVPVIIVVVVLALCAMGGLAYLWGRRKNRSPTGRGLTGAPAAPSRGGLASQEYQPPQQVTGY